MKILRFVILLSLAAALLAGCGALPPVFPDAAGPTAAVQAPVEPAAPAEAAAPPESTASPEAAASSAPTEPAANTPEAAAPAATVVAPVEAQTTPDAEPVMGENPLVGTVWEWAALIKTKPATQSVVPDPASYTATFAADGQLLIKADCNNALATYTLADDALTIELGPVTARSLPARLAVSRIPD